MADDNDIDDREFYEPAWLSQPRGFIDMPTVQADALNDLLDQFLPLWAQKAVSQRHWCSRFPDLEIELIADAGQTMAVSANSSTMGRKYLDALRIELRAILNRTLLDCGSCSGRMLGVLLLQMAEEAEICLQSWKASTTSNVKAQKAAEGDGWDINSVDLTTALYTNPKGLNLGTADDTARFILGQSISEICAGWSSDKNNPMRILHVEPVFRDDLVARFLTKKQEIHDRLRSLSVHQLRSLVTREHLRDRRINDSKESLAAHLVEPSITFHGSPRHKVRSIVRYGFVIPGQQIGHTGDKLGVQCGSSFGVGIYSSPSPVLGSWYAGWSDGGNSGFISPAKMPGMRLLVCATLMGRAAVVTREETRRKEGLICAEADSHVSPSGLEYIVFDPAQILPCYVLHVDYGPEVAKQSFAGLLESRRQSATFRMAKREDRRNVLYPNLDNSPGEVQRRKEARKAAAAKWFPYGFGPMNGSNFVIEEIGEISDDEEEYGEFQSMRHDGEDEMPRYEESGDGGGGGGSWFDQYQTVRSTNKQIRLEKQSRY